MHKSLFVLWALLTGLNIVKAQVKIGSAGIPNTNAVLELDGGTSKGLLLPKLTNSEITALTTAPDGLVVYNKTDNFLYIRKAAVWQKISDATNGGGLTLPYIGSAAIASTLFSVTNTTGSDAIRGTGNSGDGINGLSNTGNGGYFTSTSGNALVTLTGNVGIATLSPQFPLDINGRARIRSNGPFNSAGIWYDKIYTSGLSSFVGTFNDSTFGIYGGGNWKFLFDHVNNNFGINNSAPKAPLSFASSVGNKISLWGDASGGHYGFGIQGSLMQLYSNAANADIAFGYGSSTAFTENMRIRGNGNVGIGTTNPLEKLEVAGNIKVGGSLFLTGKVNIGGGFPFAGAVLTAINSNGEARWQAPAVYNTGFHASTLGGTTGTVEYNDNISIDDFDDGNNFSNIMHSYTVPVSGVYTFQYNLFPVIVPAPASGGIVQLTMYVNTGGVFRDVNGAVMGYSAGELVNDVLHGSSTLKLLAGDKVSIVYVCSISGAPHVETTWKSSFSGHRVY